MSRTRYLVGLLAFSAVAASCGAVRAQMAAPAAGPTPGGNRISLTAAERVTYDDNAAGGSAGLAALRGLTPQDVVYASSLGAMLQQPIGSQIVFLQANGEIDRHQKNSSLDAQNLTAAVGFSGHLGACTGGVTEDYSRQRTATSQLVLIVAKNISNQLATNLQVNCQTGKVSGGLFATHVELKNSAAGYVDSTSDTVGTNIGYYNNTLGSLSVASQINRISYAAPVLAGAVQTPDVETFSGGLTYKRRVGLRLSGEISVFYSSVDSKRSVNSLAAQNTNFKGLTSNVSLHYQPTSRTQLEIQYNRSVQPSSSIGSTFSVSQMGTVSGTYALSTRVNLRLGGSLQQNNYKGGVPLVGVVQRDETKTVFASATLKVGRYASLDLSATHSNRDTDVAIFNQQDSRVTLAVTGKF